MTQKPPAGGAFRREETGRCRSRAPARVCAAAHTFCVFRARKGCWKKKKGTASRPFPGGGRYLLEI
ncbi:hypothetical protein B5E84_09360 [Lachnoclostridium sp. An14]|nr:hypothetical protein B5E84_09360 [Lachnoclostridium sp. An14]